MTCNAFAGKEVKLIMGRTGIYPQTPMRFLEKIFNRQAAGTEGIQKRWDASNKTSYYATTSSDIPLSPALHPRTGSG
jgi:hypothetical protein